MISSWVLSAILAASSTVSAAAVSSAEPKMFSKRCDSFQYNAGSVYIGTFCTISVGPPKLKVRQTGIGVSGTACLPEVFLLNDNEQHRTNRISSGDPTSVGGDVGWVDAFGTAPNFDVSSVSSNLQSIEVTGGTNSNLDVSYHFKDGSSYPRTCSQNYKDFCEGHNIGEAITGSYYKCDLPDPATVAIDACDECCGDVIKGC